MFSIAQRTTPAPFLGEYDDDGDIGGMKQGNIVDPEPSKVRKSLTSHTIQAQFLIGYAAASPANRLLSCQETELLIICGMVVMQPGMVSFF